VLTIFSYLQYYSRSDNIQLASYGEAKKIIFNLVKIQIPAPIIKANTIRPRKSGASNLTKKTITEIIIIKAMIPIIAVPIVEAVPITIRLDYSSEY
jgi:hypothetical protein